MASFARSEGGEAAVDALPQLSVALMSGKVLHVTDLPAGSRVRDLRGRLERQLPLDPLTSYRLVRAGRSLDEEEECLSGGCRHLEAVVVDTANEAFSPELLATYQEAWQLFDRDGSGVDEGELGALLRALGEELSSEEWQVLERELGPGGDRRLGFRRFLGLMAQRKSLRACQLEVDRCEDGAYEDYVRMLFAR